MPTSRDWPTRGLQRCSCQGGFWKLAQHTELPTMSRPRLKGAASTLGQTSPPAAWSTPLMPPAQPVRCFSTCTV